jgi:hypothetical protein
MTVPPTMATSRRLTQPSWIRQPVEGQLDLVSYNRSAAVATVFTREDSPNADAVRVRLGEFVWCAPSSATSRRWGLVHKLD